MLREVLIFGTIIAVVILLIRIIITTPFAANIREQFEDKKPLNTTASCPANTQLYMYGGSAYCCSGSVNTKGSRLVDTCKPTQRRDESFVFCTLGPGNASVKNCMTLRSGLLAAEGAELCPRNMPTYVKNASGAGRCCADPGNPALTECVGATYCDPTSDPNYFKDTTSCQFRKAKESVQCPTGFGVFTATGQGPMANITLMGCTDNGQNCYPESTIKRLKELGYNVEGLSSCSGRNA